ncbi:MAG: Rieske (2Fe-2S) protein [Candidatus Nanopelagicaceae bacterium]|nr:Rieske (2Fe-2S) protein [Candidatus Nanopelagicaceae bacterium]
MSIISRKNFLALAATTFLQSRFSIASAASGPSLKPTRLGQTIIWRGKKYTAIKSGKKIVWNKGAPLTYKRTEAPLPSIANIDLAASNEVPDGMTQVFSPRDRNARGKGFFVSRENGVLNAFDTTCTHEKCQVQNGLPRLVCACHLSFFNRITGFPEEGPAKLPLQNYPVKETSGRIIVTVAF